MPRRTDIDSAVEHLSRYMARDDWKDHRRAHLESMLGRIPEHFGLELDALFEEIRRLGHFTSVAAFLDESFMAAEHGPERANVTDDYLRRRGWQETPRAREYLQGIRATLPSLYEVHDVEWGQWIEVRDRLRSGPPIRIVEHTGSQTLQRWDCLIARVVHPRDEEMLTAGVLSLSRKIADDIEGLFQRVAKRGRKDLAAVARELGVDPAMFGDVDGEMMQFADRLCFHGWLKGLLDAARRPPPALQNTDGDPLLPTRARLPMIGTAADITRVMDSLAGWGRVEDDESRWTWAVGADDQGTVLGSAWLVADALIVETNSRERMDRALPTLQAALGPLVGAGLVSHEDVTRVLRDAVRDRGSSGRDRSDARTVPRTSEEAAAIAEALHHFKDAHYRRTLDEPVPMLGNRTPRECARSRQGRRKLASWIKDLENGELRQAADQQLEPYDITWLWRELGVEDER